MPRKPHRSRWLSPTALIADLAPAPGARRRRLGQARRARAPEVGDELQRPHRVFETRLSAQDGSALDADRRGQAAVNRQMTAPVMYAAAGDSRNATTPATSSGFAKRPAGIWPSVFSRWAGILAEHVGVDEARRDVVDGDAASRRLDGQGPRVAEHGGLRGGVGPLPLLARSAVIDADADDASVPAAQSSRGRGPRPAA